MSSHPRTIGAGGRVISAIALVALVSQAACTASLNSSPPPDGGAQSSGGRVNVGGGGGGSAGSHGEPRGGVSGGAGTGGGASGGGVDGGADLRNDAPADTAQGGRDAATPPSPDGSVPDGSVDQAPRVDASPDAPPQARNFNQLTLLAGALGGLGTADGTGTTARFQFPGTAVVDGAGNLYVTDRTTLRKIVPNTGRVTTLAGVSGASGSTDGVGAAARFTSLGGITVDENGTLYVVDDFGIRKVVPATAQVTTLAGSPGTFTSKDGTGSQAAFANILDIAYAGGGVLYATESGLGEVGRIRKITLAGEVTTLATTLPSDPSTNVSATAVASDGAGALYAAARSGIYKVSTSTGEATQIPGVTFSEVQGGGLRFDGASNLLVSDLFNNVIVKIALANSALTTVAGTAGVRGSADGVGAAAQFARPWGVASDGHGNAFVADTYNGLVRKVVLSTGAVTTVAGAIAKPGFMDGASAVALLSAPAGVASDELGHVYVVDSGNNVIRKIAAGTGLVSTVAGGGASSNPSADGIGAAARFNFQGPFPPNLTYDGAGNLFVAEVGTNLIRQLSLSTKAVTTLAGTTLGDANKDGVGSAAQFSRPCGIASDGAGHLFVADGFHGTIRQIVAATGEVTTLAGSGNGDNVDGVGTAAAFLFSRPPRAGIAYDKGALFVADGVASIRRIDVATATVTTFAGKWATQGTVDGTGTAARFTAPTGIAADGAGNLLVAEGERIRKIAIATGAVTTVAGTAGQTGVTIGPLPTTLNTARGICVLPDGSAAISDTTENAVLQLR